MPQAVFKCHFGGENGWGHVTRSSALAQALQGRGWKTMLWSNGDVSQVPKEVFHAFDQRIAELTTEDNAESPAFLCIDEMYTTELEMQRLAARWRSLPGKRRVLALDDMRARQLPTFDLVVNSEIGLRQADYKANRALLGERYALLREGFARPQAVAQDALPLDAAWVLIMLGGTDPFGYVQKVLVALAEVDSQRYAPALVGGLEDGADGPIAAALSAFRFARSLGRLESYELAGWMQRCAFGIVACGSSLCELAAMKLPFVGISLVDNQRVNGRRAAERWGMPIIDREGRHDTPLDLRPALKRVERRLRELNRQSFADVDAMGAARVADAMEEML